VATAAAAEAQLAGAGAFGSTRRHVDGSPSNMLRRLVVKSPCHHLPVANTNTQTHTHYHDSSRSLFTIHIMQHKHTRTHSHTSSPSPSLTRAPMHVLTHSRGGRVFTRS
jgi:hypothetical protein